MHEQSRYTLQRLITLTALGILIVGLLLMPWVFSATLAVMPLVDYDEEWLGIAWKVCLGLSVVLLVLRKRMGSPTALMLFGVLLLIGLEFLSRLLLPLIIDDRTVAYLESVMHQIDSDHAVYQAHPFLQYNATPNAAIKSNERNPNRFNTQGFQQEKPVGVIRIAAIGGSTTAWGYPMYLERWLNQQLANDSVRWQVYNFGVMGGTSAHNLVDFLLNIDEYDPDYLVIHQRWNDVGERNNNPGSLQPDYAQQPYQDPFKADHHLVRVSFLYRYLKYKLNPENMIGRLDEAMLDNSRPVIDGSFGDLQELEPFERNIRTVIDQAKLQGIQPVLTTQPHALDAKLQFMHVLPHIEQCNTVLRQVATADSSLVFVDLDLLMTGVEEEHFIDLSHLDEAGMQIKAQAIGQAILTQRNQRP